MNWYLAIGVPILWVLAAGCGNPKSRANRFDMMAPPASTRQATYTQRDLRMQILDRDANLELRTHDYASAERDFQQLISMDPGNPFHYRGLAMAYDAEGKSKEAYDAWTKTLNGSPNGRSSDQTDPYILANYGELCLKNGDERGASKAFGAASQSIRILTDPKFESSPGFGAQKQTHRVLAHYNAGIEMCLGGQKDRARRALQEVVQLAPNWGAGKVALAYELWREGRNEEAEALLEPLEAGRGAMAQFAMRQARTLGLNRNLTMLIRGLPNGKTVDTMMTIDEWNRKHPDHPLQKHPFHRSR